MRIKRTLGHNKLFLAAICLMLIASLFSGCSKINDVQVRLGLKNNDFEYIKQNKVQKIIIQSTRDKGFRFLVTDTKAISELYDILSSAKTVKEKTNLEPDYIFEMYEGNNIVHKFKYVAGLDRKDFGNLYSDNKIYIVSKRIDNDIIKSFWTIRKPKDFEVIYYKSIINAIEKYGTNANGTKKVGINIYDDVDVAKFILSTDLEDFKSELSSKTKNTQLMTNAAEKENYDSIISVQTQGYKSTLYKAIITFTDKSNNNEKKVYILDKYESGQWNMNISETKQSDF
ncbi:MAG: putative lipoprotein [Clostridiaceae bacterium]|nr:putative lipoprotein [Clostridiaceae bacterium]